MQIYKIREGKFYVPFLLENIYVIFYSFLISSLYFPRVSRILHLDNFKVSAHFIYSFELAGLFGRQSLRILIDLMILSYFFLLSLFTL